MSEPIVSVVIPAYNGAALIGETLASLGAQTLTAWEAIVVDDVSQDDTRALVAAWPDPRVRLLCNQENGGPVRTRNRGVAEARGRYIAGLDQDDLCRPDRLAAQVTHLDAHPDIVLLGAQADILCEGRIRPSRYPAVTTPTLVEWLLQISNPLVWSSIMVRGDVARALHPFTRPEILFGEDFDLYHRLRPHGRIARLDTPHLLYREHPGGVSKRYADTMTASAIRVLTEAHAPILGDHAQAAATLLVHHVMRGQPVPDRAALVALGEVIATLQRHFLAHHPATPDDIALIRWETARRWAAIGRAGLKAGTITLADRIAARPDHLGLGYDGPAGLALAGALGHARRWATRTR